MLEEWHMNQPREDDSSLAARFERWYLEEARDVLEDTLVALLPPGSNASAMLTLIRDKLWTAWQNGGYVALKKTFKVDLRPALEMPFVREPTPEETQIRLE